MFELFFYIVLFVVIAALIMIGTNILYDLAAAILPVAAIIMVIVGIIVGFVVAIKNTFTIYKKVYFKGGR